MNKEEYGDKYSEHLLEQYKLLADSIIKLGESRARTNRFYTAMLSSFIAIIYFTISRSDLNEFRNLVLATLSFLGIILCVVWRFNIQSFGVTSACRYKILYEIEEKLPFPILTKAWNLLQVESKYIPMAKVELLIPLVLLMPYLLLFAYSVYLWVLR